MLRRIRVSRLSFFLRTAKRASDLISCSYNAPNSISVKVLPQMPLR